METPIQFVQGYKVPENSKLNAKRFTCLITTFPHMYDLRTYSSLYTDLLSCDSETDYHLVLEKMPIMFKGIVDLNVNGRLRPVAVFDYAKFVEPNAE